MGRVDEGREIGPVVHQQRRAMGERLLEVAKVGVAVLASDRKHLDLVVDDQRGRDRVVGAQRVGGGQAHAGAADLQRPHQRAGLGGHVQAGRDARALEGALALEAAADRRQGRHRALGPLELVAPLGGEVFRLDVHALTVGPQDASFKLNDF